MRYIAYLWYVTKHKWFVMIECFKKGLILEGIFHDISKFSLSEFFTYAHVFYDKHGRKQNLRDKSGHYNAGEVLGKAWHHHAMHNKHHWQYWVFVDSNILNIFKLGDDNWTPTLDQLKEFKEVVRSAVKNPPHILLVTNKSFKVEQIGQPEVLEMPFKYVVEMICDWKGAARAQGIKKPAPWEFYRKNKDKMMFNPTTEVRLSGMLAVEEGIIR